MTRRPVDEAARKAVLNALESIKHAQTALDAAGLATIGILVDLNDAKNSLECVDYTVRTALQETAR